jgi:hypothetical protein
MPCPRDAIAMIVVAATGTACEKRSVATETGRALFDEVVVDTRPGLSGLAADDTAGIWAVAERAGRPSVVGQSAQTAEGEAYRITLDAANKPAIERFAVRGVPVDTDLEGIAWLGPDRFAFGTEGKFDGIATVLTAERHDGAIDVTGAIVLDAQTLGLALKANQGAEGVCGAGDTIIASIEVSAVDGGRRWAPVARIEHGKVVRVYRLWLLTSTGKVSALDCRIAPDGTVTAWGIERHFEVTRLMTFTLPPVGVGGEHVHPTELVDLAPALESNINLEGLAVTSDGRVVAVLDNQWKTITGPSELLVFRPGVVKVSP